MLILWMKQKDSPKVTQLTECGYRTQDSHTHEPAFPSPLGFSRSC